MKKVKSSAIYYALFLSVIFSLILGGMVLFSSFNQRFALEMDVAEVLIDNVNSGIAYGQANFRELKENEPLSIRLFGEGIDSVEILKKNWGVFTVIRSSASHRNRLEERIALFGGFDPQNDLPNLYLADHGRPISICGSTRLEGKCFLPKSGVKRAYIEGKNYQGDKMIYGTVSESQKHLPGIRPDFLETLSNIPGELEQWEQQDSIINSFGNEIRHVVNDNFIQLTNTLIKGQVVIEAKDSIFIAADAVIENAVLKSKVIYIESGFTGTAQIFASEKVVLEENVHLKYPSVVGIIENEYPEDDFAQLIIAERSQIIGAVFLVSKIPNFRLPPALSIEQEGEVDGLVYCGGKLQLKGTVKGSLYAEKLFLKTASSAYENHLLDGELLDQLPENFVIPNILNETTHLKQIAWLE